MHLANLTTAGFKRIFGLLLSISIFAVASAQENSPYSRYGIGDIVPNQNIVSRAMGGISAGYTNPNYGDHKYITPALLFQSINLVNPASLGGLNNTIFDVGGEVDIRTLRSTTSPAKYRATNTLISYLQVGFPIASEKMKKKSPHKKDQGKVIEKSPGKIISKNDFLDDIDEESEFKNDRNDKKNLDVPKKDDKKKKQKLKFF